MLPFTEADVRRWYDPGTYKRGVAYRRAGHARILDVTPDGTEITGSVRGSERSPYLTTVGVTHADRTGMVGFSGICTCYLGGECKHEVALLLEALATDSPAVPTPQDGLTPELRRWLGTLAADAPPGTGAPSQGRMVLYRLDMGPDGRTATVQVLTAPRRKDGSPGAHSKPLGRSTIASIVSGYGAPNYVTPQDAEVLRVLSATGPGHTGGPYGHHGAVFPLAGALAPAVLEAMLATGRTYWRAPGGPPLHAGGPRRGEGRWIADDGGVLRFAFVLPDGSAEILPLVPPWYVSDDGACGRLDTGLADRHAHTLATAPPIALEAIEAVRAALAPRLPAALLPTAPEVAVRDDVQPRPLLFLGIDGWVEQPDSDTVFDDPIEVVHGRLGFDYAGQVVDADDSRTDLRRVEDGRCVIVHRRPDLEAQAAARLHGIGFVDTSDPALYALPPEDDGSLLNDPSQELLGFLHRTAPVLRAEGWTVALADGWLPDIVDAGDWTARVEEPSGVDWFGLSLGVAVGDERIDLLPLLLPMLRAIPDGAGPEPLAAAAADAMVYLPMPDGRVLPIAADRLNAMLRTLYDLYQVGGIAPDGTIRLSSLHAAELAETEAATAAAGLRWMGGERLREAGARLRDFAGIVPVPAPAGLAATLRPYQAAGLNWMQFLRDHGFGGVLADDMGLGKTVQALAHMLAEKEAGRLDRPCLVVAPTSLMPNWRAEAARFAPGLRTLVLHGPDRKDAYGRIADHDLVLTTYPLLPRDKALLLEREWHLLILDEAQAIKNPQSQLSRVAMQLRARHRLCLTGTPLENNLGELWSLFHFLMPGLLGDARGFQTVFRTPIEKKGDTARGRLLARRVRPFLLRRTKDEVAGDLPAKTEIVERVALDGAQRDLYETIRLAMDAKVRAEVAKKGLARSHIVILEALLKLRQACCDPRLVKQAEGSRGRVGSAKLSRLMELVPELVAEGRRILLFSQFTSMLALIEAELTAAGIPFAVLTGRTRDRATPIARFQEGAVPVFLISLKAGGTGLNLTAADTVIHYDPWWNPAVERQATDRAHRIGQDKPVFVHKLVAVGTVEEAIMELQARKQALADALFDPDAGDAGSLTAADLDALFTPITS